MHDRAQAIAALEEAALAFDTFNLDLMYALPGQTLEGLERDLDQALALAPPHLSVYHLTIEPNTYFAKFPPRRAGRRHGLRDARPHHRAHRRAGLEPLRGLGLCAAGPSLLRTTSTTGSSATTSASAPARTAS